MAQDGPGGGVGIASAQVQRGISPSSGEPALFADAYWRFAGGWSLNAGAVRWRDLPGRQSGEYTLGASRSHRFDDDWTAALGVTHYGRLGGRPTRRVEYGEMALSVGYADRGQALLAWSPNYTTTDRDGRLVTRRTVTMELSWHQPMPAPFERYALDAGIGHFSLRAFDRPGYLYASLGASRSFGPLQASLAYVANDGVSANVPPAVRRSRWLLSLWWSY